VFYTLFSDANDSAPFSGKMSPEQDESSTESRENVLRYLCVSCGPDEAAISSSMQYFNNQKLEDLGKLEVQKRLREICRPKYEDIFLRLLSEADEGMAPSFFLQLREDILAMIKFLDAYNAKSSTDVDMETNLAFPIEIAQLRHLEEDLKHLLSILFSAGALGE